MAARGRRAHFLAVLVLLATLTTASLAVTGEAGPRGVVQPKVALSADPSQTFALYLPTSFDPQRPTPLLICFDPAGRGSLPVSAFGEIADAYGVVVVGSNVVRNGAMAPALSAVDALWRDLSTRFRIDPRRRYVAGFSGGAMVAFEVALSRPNEIAGVIACSGALPYERKLQKVVPFSVAMTAGSADFNRVLMEDLRSALDATTAPHRLLVFAGAHDWPGTPTLRDAWEWLEVQSLREGRRRRDPAFQNRLLDRALTRARERERSGRMLEAYELYVTIGRDFEGMGELGQARSAVARIADSAAYRRELRELNRDRELQLELLQQIDETLERLDPKLVPDPNARQRLIAHLNLRRLRSSDTEGARAALSRAFIDTNYRGLEALMANQLPRGLMALAIAVELEPRAPLALYNYACALSRAGEKKLALTYLKRAVETGQFTADQLARDHDFDPLRGELEFKQLLRPQL